jgi:putative sugar O-methyltransferase
VRWYLGQTLYVPARVSTDYWFRLSPQDRRLPLKGGFADHRNKPEHRRPDPALVRRIIAAYKAAKRDQDSAPEAFRIKGIWLEWVNVHYRPLVDALMAEDVTAVSALLANFNREEFTVGTGGGYDDYRMFRNSPLARWYIKCLWASYRNKLLSQGFDLSRLEFPLVGNPFGPLYQGKVMQTETVRHTYKACEVTSLLRDVENAVVVEIGGGLGGQAYQTVRLSNPPIGKYLIFDLPEVAVVSSYFLAEAFPDRRVRFYGEGPVSTGSGEGFDLGVFPHFSIPRVEDASVDLFFNTCSLGEMDAAQSHEYLSIVERCGRRYFYHVNHETEFVVRGKDGAISHSATGSQLVPDPTRFKRVYKHPRVLGRPEDPSLGYFAYLYERCARPLPVESGAA